VKRFGILLFAAVLAFGLLFPQVSFATGNHSGDKWDSFCKPDKWPEKPKKKWYGGDCDGIFVKVKLPRKWKEIEGTVKVDVYWSETGKLRDAQPVSNGTLELKAGEVDQFTYDPDKSGFYWFKLSREGKPGALWTKKIKVDCPEQPGQPGDNDQQQPGEPPKDDDQQGGEQPGVTQPDDKGQSGNNGQSGEIPNNKSGQGGGQLPKTATSHPQSMLIGLLLALVGAGILAYRRRFA